MSVTRLCLSLVLTSVFLFAVNRMDAETSQPTKVYIFAGQSNMEGADAHSERIDDFPAYKGVGSPQPDVRYTHLSNNRRDPSKRWGPLQPLGSFGPELTFARMVRKHDDSPIAVIKSAVGGTTIAYDWNPEAPEKGQKLYPRTLQLIQESLQDLDRRGVRYQVEAVMWHQGENDMLDRRLNTNYAAGLTKLIGQLRKDLKLPMLKWFIAEVSEKGIWGMDHRSHLAILRQQQDQVLKADPLLRWVPTSHLAFEVMESGQPHYHFGTQGQLQMGEAFATAYLDSIGKRPPTPSQEFRNGLPLVPKAPVRLFVLAGQRNMEGEDTSHREIPQVAGFEPLASPQQDVLFRYSLGGGVKISRTWEPLAPVDFLGNFGPELSFGARLRKSLDGKEGLAIVKFTHSGAQGPDWFPRGSPQAHRNLYPQLVSFIRAALQDLNQQGYQASIEGIFWHTGENDTYFGEYRQKNAGWMKELIAQVRTDLNQPDLQWFISEQHPAAIWRNIATMNASLQAMAQSEKKVYVIKTADLPHQRVHFGTRGTLLLGEEMANAYLKRR